MKPAMLIGIAAFVVCVAIGIYYLIPIPNGTHIFASKVDKPDPTHAIAFFVVGIIAVIAGRFASNASSSK
jgi:hypothetical protein